MKLTKLIITMVILSSMAFANLDDAIDTMGKELQQNLLSKKSKMIAIIDFNNLDGSVNNLGRNISEKLAIKLFRLNKDNNYTIVERGQLSKILQELKLSASGLVEPKSMKKIGKIYGVDTIISGSLTDLGNDIEIKVKALSVETGGMMGVSESKIPKTNMVKNLYTQNLVEGQYTTVGTSSKTAKTSSNSKKPQYEYKDKYFHITLKKIKKKNKTISMVVTYRNISDKNIVIILHTRNTILTDENGAVWKNTGSSSFLGDQATVNVGQKVITKMTFETQGDADGTLFNLNAKYEYWGLSQITMIVNDIPIP